MRLLLPILLLGLSGCAGFDQSRFENRLTCTVAKDRAFVASLYGPVGITSELSKLDVPYVCQ